MSEYVIPYCPRPPQGEIHQRLEAHRFSVLVAHRRLGKTVLAVNHLLKSALTCTKVRPRFGYIAPFRNQAKLIAWDYIKHYASALPGLRINESDLSIELFNGATIRIFGADNPDSMRGTYFDGCVMDEVAQMKPEVWGEIVRPAVADRGGWVAFIGTPKGINLFSQLYDKALELQTAGNEDWCAMLYSVEQTHVIPPKELEALRQEMTENQFRQEFLCDFNAEADDALFPIDLIRQAAARHYRPSEYDFAPTVIGVDVARFGSDSSVIAVRQGVVLHEPEVFHGLDTLELANAVARAIAKWKPFAVYIDAGEGGGVIDTLRRGMGFTVTEVHFGGSATDKTQYVNKRTEMYASALQWIKAGGAIPPNERLQSDLAVQTYGYSARGLKALERKEDLKKRLGRSPDLADAFVLTFAAPTPPNLLRQDLNTDDSYSYSPMQDFEERWNRA